jgi:hypothetical protein
MPERVRAGQSGRYMEMIEMPELTPAERAVLFYLIKAIEAGRAPVMRELTEQFHWIPVDELHEIINSSLYGKGYINFRLGETPSLVIAVNPFKDEGTAKGTGA